MIHSASPMQRDYVVYNLGLSPTVSADPGVSSQYVSSCPPPCSGAPIVRAHDQRPLRNMHR